MQIGIDLGSRAIKMAVFRDGVLAEKEVVESPFEPHKQAAEMVSRYTPSEVVATGYGRHLAQKHFAQKVITEIKAHAQGARYCVPECRTILDVGGQDSKVIALDGNGRVVQFHMNDKCAAGTGRFLEIMSASLGYSLEEFSVAARSSSQDIPINSMCAVFAESEVVSLRNRGFAAADIARAIHLAVADRLSGMLERVGISDEVVFSGGVANNQFLVDILGGKIGRPITVPSHPEIVGAIGAALHREKTES
ncbi:MAG: 3-hydroxyacyl-ACP dehydratase [Desulfuromonas sp.]|nr:MAG: 3-hydroxyacyl-ACP dehydratase [Desulfuromonas sp.]